jgi:hypothetical protein
LLLEGFVSELDELRRKIAHATDFHVAAGACHSSSGISASLHLCISASLHRAASACSIAGSAGNSCMMVEMSVTIRFWKKHF